VRHDNNTSSLKQQKQTQFPTKAADAQGDHGRQLPTLEDEWRRLRLEQLVDAELERIAARKERQKQDSGKGGSKQ
jgi:cell division protein FtsL